MKSNDLIREVNDLTKQNQRLKRALEDLWNESDKSCISALLAEEIEQLLMPPDEEEDSDER